MSVTVNIENINLAERIRLGVPIQIAPDYRGNRIGRKILNDLISEAIVSKKKAALSVLKTNRANLYT
nr:GNAT family N-acetyltransferase [uncultured Sphingobacterium sp.]